MGSFFFYLCIVEAQGGAGGYGGLGGLGGLGGQGGLGGGGAGGGYSAAAKAAKYGVACFFSQLKQSQAAKKDVSVVKETRQNLMF